MKAKSLTSKKVKLEEVAYGDIKPKPTVQQEYEPTSAKKLFKMYQKIHKKIFVKEIKDFFFRGSESIQETFQKLSRILTKHLIDPESYLTVQMSVLHDTMVKKHLKFHPKMLVSDKALERFWNVTKSVRDHGHSVSSDTVESILGYQELYSDISVSEKEFGQNLIQNRMSGLEVSTARIMEDIIEFAGESWMSFFRDEIQLEDYIDDLREERLELIEQTLRYEDSNAYRSNFLEKLRQARSNSTICVLHIWVPFSYEGLEIEDWLLTTDPFSYWWSISNFLFLRISMLPEEIKHSKIPHSLAQSEGFQLPDHLGKRWGEHL